MMSLKIDDNELTDVIHMAASLNRIADETGRVHTREAAVTFTATRRITQGANGSIAAFDALKTLDEASTVIAVFHRKNEPVLTLTLSDVKVETYEAESANFGSNRPTETFSVSAGEADLNGKIYTRDNAFYS